MDGRNKEKTFLIYKEMIKNKLENIVLTIIIINYSLLISLVLLIVSPLGHVSGTAHPLIIILAILYFLSIFSALANEILLIILIFKKQLVRKKLLLILNSIYLIFYLLLMIFFAVGGRSV